MQRRVGLLRSLRVFDGWRRFKKGVEERGETTDPEAVRELLIEAEPILADAATEQKRQLIANILVNGERIVGILDQEDADDDPFEALRVWFASSSRGPGTPR